MLYLRKEYISTGWIEMVWIRYARIRAIWRCYTTRGYSTKYHVVGVAIKDEYEKRPIEDIDTWAIRLGDFVVDKMCTNSCESLSTSVFCDKTSLQVEVIYTSETLTEKPHVVRPPVAVPKVPTDVLASIERLKTRKKRVSPEIATMIQKEIDSLKKKYGIK